MSFCKDFIWGAATAAYQIEGGARADGRGDSIWDVYCRRPGRVYQGHTGEQACDHYHRYREDVALMAQLGIRAYRLSISWPRVLPNGVGQVNQAGLAFYSDLIDALLENGITPYVTLYHWDLPEALAVRGGWLNPESPAWFEEYARTVVDALGNRVKHWMPFNEPQVFVGLGYVTAVHAPGEALPRREYLQMSHNILLAHGRSVRAIRELCAGAQVGTAHAGLYAYPATDAPKDAEAARRYLFDCVHDENPVSSLAWWADPMFLGRYPDFSAIDGFAEDMPAIASGDMELISQPLDFLGFNLYQGDPVSADAQAPHGIRVHPFPEGVPMSYMNWPVTPEAMYFAVKEVYSRYRKPVFITENGMASNDMVSLDGKVHDPNRIDYTARYLQALRQAADEGAQVRGYFHWSLMDNFEWAEGYRPRFGLIYVDYATKKRIPKDSFYWYRDVIAQNGKNL